MAFRDTVIARYGRPSRESDPHDAASRGENGSSPDQQSLTIVEEEFPNARSLLLRCVQFPLYPALTGKEAALVERVLSTLP